MILYGLRVTDDVVIQRLKRSMLTFYDAVTPFVLRVSKYVFDYGARETSDGQHIAEIRPRRAVSQVAWICASTWEFQRELRVSNIGSNKSAASV